MTQGDGAVGVELRRLRKAANLSLAQLAALTHFSKGHLSKIENGKKQLRVELARSCDGILNSGGVLTRLASTNNTPRTNTSSNNEHSSDMNCIENEGHGPSVNRRKVLKLFAISPLLGDSRRTAGPPEAALSYFTGLFDHDRTYGQLASAPEVLERVGTHVRMLRELTNSLRTVPRELALLDARYTEYAGWMAQEAGADHLARQWTAEAVQTAATAGDHDLADYALVRQALVELYAGRGQQTITLARRAQRRPETPPRILALAAQREAQGHALAGDYGSCRRALDRAEQFFAVDATRPSSGPVLGPRNLASPVRMVTGWCLTDLGKHAEAAEILDREVERITPGAMRSRVRFGVRRALAHARAGELDHACELTERLLGEADSLASATVTVDLCNLRQALHRQPGHPRGQQLAADINHVIHAAPH